MTSPRWRPLGADTPDEVARYDALHDGVPTWMAPAFWQWIRDTLIQPSDRTAYGQALYRVKSSLVSEMGQELQIPLPLVRAEGLYRRDAEARLEPVISILMRQPNSLSIADYLLYRGAPGAPLDEVLRRAKSAYKVGERTGYPGLERRVAEGVQDAADHVMQQSDGAGRRLAEAWGALYGLNADPSRAYSLAIKAVEDAVLPLVEPKNTRATLGTSIKVIEAQKDWQLPMTRDPQQAPSGEVLLNMMKLLWHAQHDRHGGQAAASPPITREEAESSIGLAVTLVHWFYSGLAHRSSTP